MAEQRRIPDPSRRCSGKVEVLRVEDLDQYATLTQKAEAMLENRCEVFLYNLDVLRRQRGLSQAALCNNVLQGLVSSPALTSYKARGKEIPLRVMATVATAFGLSVEEMCSQIIGDHNDVFELSSDRPKDEYNKYVGTYDLTYFDTSNPIGENHLASYHALNTAVLTVYSSTNTFGTISWKAAAIFNCTEEERPQVAGLMADLNLFRDNGEVRQRYRQIVDCPDPEPDAMPRTKSLYEGELRLAEQMMELNLKQVRGSDVAHLLFHNRAAQSSDGKPYSAGLGAMLSICRGAEHMPCLQAILLLREPNVTRKKDGTLPDIPASRFAPFNQEYLCSRLYLAPPHVELHQEIQDIVAYMRMLYASGENPNAVATLSPEDKAFCLETFAEKKLNTAMRRNILGFYKIALQMDSEVYQMTRVRGTGWR